MWGPRVVLVVATIASVLLLILSLFSGLAVNVASESPQWPWPLDWVRQHPWRSLLISLLVTACLGVVMARLGRPGPDPATRTDLIDTEARLRERLDAAENMTNDIERRTARLPPYAQDLLSTSSTERAAVWTVIAPFSDDMVNPRSLARAWAISPPAVIDELSPRGRLVVGELLRAYGQAEAAADHMQIAVSMGVAPTVRWLFRVAHLLWTADTEGSQRLEEVIAAANRVDPSYPLLRSLILFMEGVPEQVDQLLAEWSADTEAEHDVALLFRAESLVRQERMDEAITLLQSSIDRTRNAGVLLNLAKLLRARSVLGTGDSRMGDAFGAIEFAVRARNLRRSWRGDSAEAVSIAAEAAVVAADHQQLWRLTRAEPDGEATAEEEADARVLPLAALGAALTGRVAEAKRLLESAPEGYAKKRAQAEVASMFSDDGERPAAIEAWRAAYRWADTAEEKLHTLRGLALEGVVEREALEAMRVDHPDIVEDIEVVAEFMSISGPDADERLRVFESRNPLVSVRRAELRRADDPTAAAEILIAATERWRYPRLLLLALDCYVDAGLWRKADELAQRALAEGGTLGPGRITVMRRMLDIQTALGDWSKVEGVSRMLLEIDQHDEPARWHLVHAQFRGGAFEEAWRTYRRAVPPMSVTLPLQAQLVLELARRNADATTVAMTALDMLRKFPDVHDVHWAAINSITMRIDRTDLPDDLGDQVTSAWESFFDRYPHSKVITAYKVRDDDNPLAEVEDMLRQQAQTFHEVREMIRDQGMPIGVLERVVGKPYAAIFPYRPLGYHRAMFPGELDIAVELDIARSASGGMCLVDASALHMLTLLPELSRTLLSLIAQPAITDAAFLDLIAAEDLFGMPSMGTIEYDPVIGRVVAHDNDRDIHDQQLSQIGEMLATARDLRRITHPALLHLQSMRPDREPVWLLQLDAAKDKDIAIWADDAGLRTLAHALGIKVFGTQSLLQIARERGRIDTEALDKAALQLIREYVVDMPYDHEALLQIGAEQHWEPRSVATVLSRSSTWTDAKAPLELFRTAFHKAPESTLTVWAHAALTGLRDITLPERRAERLTAFTVLTISHERTRPDQAVAFVAALTSLMPDEVGTITRAALDRIWSLLTKTYTMDRAVTVFLYIVSRLDDVHRQHATQLILKVPSDQ